MDNESGDAWAAYAITLWWQKDFPAAERELRRAIALNPGSSISHIWLSQLMRAMGRLDEARREVQLAYELDPFATVPNGMQGWHSFHDREFDRSLVHYRRAAQVGAYAGPWVFVALNFSLKDMHDSALYAAHKAADLAPERPGVLGVLAYVQARAGQEGAARETLRRAKLDPREPFDIGRAYVALHEPDSAFAWLERANWQWPHRAILSDPTLDPLRADPRFARLTARVARDMGIQ